MIVRKAAGGIPGSEGQLTNMRLLTAAECRFPAGASEKIRQKICTSQKIWYTIYVSEKDRILPRHKTDSPSEFLSFYVCAAAERRGLFVAGRIRHTVCVNTQKKERKKI